MSSSNIETPSSLMANEPDKAIDKLDITQDSSNVFQVDNSFEEILAKTTAEEEKK